MKALEQVALIQAVPSYNELGDDRCLPSHIMQLLWEWEEPSSSHELCIYHEIANGQSKAMTSLQVLETVRQVLREGGGGWHCLGEAEAERKSMTLIQTGWLEAKWLQGLLEARKVITGLDQDDFKNSTGHCHDFTKGILCKKWMILPAESSSGELTPFPAQQFWVHNDLRQTGNASLASGFNLHMLLLEGHKELCDTQNGPMADLHAISGAFLPLIYSIQPFEWLPTWIQIPSKRLPFCGRQNEGFVWILHPINNILSVKGCTMYIHWYGICTGRYKGIIC